MTSINPMKEEGTWDLTELAPPYTTTAFKTRLTDIEAKAQIFEVQQSRLTNEILSHEFSTVLQLFEELLTDVAKIGYYANLLFSADTSNSDVRSLLAQITQFLAQISNRILFFELWWKKGIDEANAQRLLQQRLDLKYYLQRLRELACYSLTEAEEKIINIKDTTGISFLRKFYDQYTSRFVFPMTVKGKTISYTQSKLLTLVRNPDPQLRENAYHALFTVYGQNADILGELYRNVILDWKNEGIQLRGYSSPISIRNVANDIPDDIIDTLLDVCVENRGIFQRYFQRKASYLNMDTMTRYHIYAPFQLPSTTRTFPETVDLVDTALKHFSPTFAAQARQVLLEQHLDWGARKGKRSGAFCATATPAITPYVLMTFTGVYHDAFTLAHELGHAVHSLLASAKSILIQSAPLPLAELASVFAENLVYDYLLKDTSPSDQRGLIMNQLDGMYATIQRQAFFTIFEQKAHRAVEDGATASDLSTLYYDNLEAQFGEAVDVNAEFQHEWTYIPHFYRTPFYTYAYSFGNLLALALYQTYKSQGQSFVEKFLDLLASGGSERPSELLLRQDIDIASRQFWQNGFQYITDRLDVLDQLNES
ncbi:MAG: M3 family oligoendopeptidase [Candidatus Bathyarchaeota archaeon]|nr:M3 family oligoendopeptidase [Candidatus Bathyarchaeota archaeon]